MPCTGRLRQSQRDRPAGSGLNAEGGFLDYRNGRRWRRWLGCRAGWTRLGTLTGGTHGGHLITVGRTICEGIIRIAGRGDWTGVELAVSPAIHRAVQVIARGTAGSIPHQAYLSISGRGRKSGG